MDKIDAEMLAQRLEEIAAEALTVIEQQSFRNRLILQHGGDRSTHHIHLIGASEEDTVDVGARVIIEVRELISRLTTSGENYFLQEVTVPKAVWVLTLTSTLV